MSSDLPQRIFVMTGLPRSGTTYLAAVLYNPPEVVTLSEAGGVWKRLYREHGPTTRIFEACADFRRRISAGEPVLSFAQTDGFHGQGRVDTWNQPKTAHQIETTPDFLLGFKNPEVFLEFLPVFVQARIPCVITVRHPVRVINSWVKRVKPRLVRGGNIEGTFANGESVGFTAGGSEAVGRRIELYNALLSKIINVRGHSNVLVIRHEDWSMQQLQRVCSFLGVSCPTMLRPPVIPPDAIELDDAECQAICRGCAAASEFGYRLTNNALSHPDQEMALDVR